MSDRGKLAAMFAWCVFAGACGGPTRTFIDVAGDGTLDAVADGPRVDGAASCTDDYSCDDRIACTIDHCVAGACTHEACTDCCPSGTQCIVGVGCGMAPTPCAMDSDCMDSIPCTLDVCSEDHTCEHDPQNALCASGQICLGAIGCIARPPETCTHDADCTTTPCLGTWYCDPELGCQFRSLTNCDDANACTMDTCSDAMGGCQHAPLDADMDGHTSVACGGDDCNDHDAMVHPGAMEICGNGIDDNCNGMIDEGCCASGISCTTSCGSTGMTVCTGSSATCAPPAETCNGRDDDCDGVIDDGFACAAGSTGPCATTCGSTGSRTCLGSCAWDVCVPPAEICNGVDDNCNGTCDEGFTCCARTTRDCTALGFVSGTATCESDCGSWDTAGCSNCGNHVRDAGEDCDGTDLGTATCVSEGFGGGTLRCTSGCTFDTTGCAACGNGHIDPGEQCDGTNLAGQTCSSLAMGFTGGTLACSSLCAFDTSMCTRPFDPTGTWVIAPGVNYYCAFGLVSFSFGDLMFTDTGSGLTVSGGGVNCMMAGPSARTTRMIDVTCSLAGGCTETYTLTGTFSDDDHFTGTFRAAFTGSGCAGCTTQTFSVTASR